VGVGKERSGTEGRGRLSAMQGRALVEQWRRSGLSVSAFCRTRGVREHVLRYRLSRESTPSEPAAPQGEFFVVSAPERALASAPAGDRAATAVIVMLPAVTPGELVQTLRALLEEGRA